MNKIKAIELPDKSIVYVDMDFVEDMPVVTSSVTSSNNTDALPDGAEEVTAAENAIDTLKTLKDTLSFAFTAVQDTLKNNPPDEWGVELNIGFKGKINPIPVIVGSESNVALKVHAKWKKADNDSKPKQD